MDINFINNAINKAINNESKITSDILNIPGMSGKKTRHLYNNICQMPDARYLEIGTWLGSTVCAAMYNNEIECTCIDNWSQFKGPKVQFMENFNKFKSKNAKFIESDCWDIDPKTLGKFNIYMYDGDHDISSHYRALNHYLDCLDSTFLYIVDDWNWFKVRAGTYQAILDLNLKVHRQWMVLTTNNGSHPKVAFNDSDWHNGISIFILEK